MKNSLRSRICYAPDGGGGGGAPGGGGADKGGADWIASIDGDAKGVLETKGWYKPGVTPVQALGEVVKGYVGLEKQVGADKLALPPLDAKTKTRDFSKWEGWSALGRPAKAEDYKLAPPEGAKFTDADTAFHKHMLPVLHEAGVSQSALEKIAGAYSGFAKTFGEQQQQLRVKEAETADTELKGELGAAYDATMDLANRVVGLGGDDVVKALDLNGAGRNKAVVKFLADIGKRLTERGGDLPGAKPGAGGGGAMTPEAAQAEITRIRGEAHGKPDHPYNDAKHPEHQAIHAKVLRLYEMVSPEPKAE